MQQVRSFAFGSADYDAACVLRDDVLRKPLGLTLSIIDTEGEADYSHWGLFEGETLVACLMAVPRGEDSAQIRQVAVADGRRGQGLGARLMREVEAELTGQGVTHIFLHAREPVIPFYARLGYVEAGPRFKEIGIPHQRMEKSL